MLRKSWLPAAGLAALFLLGIGLWAFRGPIDTVNIGVAYAAKQTCSCLYVAGRSLESCRTDIEPITGQAVTVTPIDNGARATAAFGLLSARAEATPNGGCVLRR